MDKDDVVVCIFPLAIFRSLKTETKTKITYLQVITTKLKLFTSITSPKTKTKLLSNILSRNSTITNNICLMLTKTTLLHIYSYTP